ncbi:uncharacterized protein LOC141632849 [Silene latifolia]|uniref:uncharacterized protein LOC141632849 n=1 Tax=Silene latifolia TaxID=37657 RepID=UPI003D771609
MAKVGGLLLRCDDSVVISTLSVHPHFILCKLSLAVNPVCINHDMYVMFIYGEPSFEFRLSLWNNITGLISVLSPFMIIGDFNQIEMHSDKLGGLNSVRGQHDFTSWRLDNALLDVPFFGPPFTWLQNRSNGQVIMERLDRAYAKSEWLQLFPVASVFHPPILISDHAPIILKFFPSIKNRRRPYRLDNWCLHSPEIAQMVDNNACQIFVPGSPMFVLSRRLAAIQYSTMQWFIHHRLSHGINWSSIQNEIHNSSNLVVDVQSTTNFQHDRSLQLQLIQKQHAHWLQRSKLKNEILDGIPSRFLYSRVKQRSSNQRILALLSRSGEWLFTPDKIDLEITSFFKELLYSTPHHDPTFPKGFIDPFLSSLALPMLSTEDCLLLSAPFSERDIVNALNGMDGPKSPGPDGITSKFFQIFWPQIGQLVTLALLRFLNTCIMLKEWNHTHIILIPKVENPELVSQFRPISLCNVIHRLASKCLANRLKLVISSIVSESQQAFVPYRLMSDGCLITHEIMHYLNKTKKGSVSYAALKLDMHKAFDRVSWQFLIVVMKKIWVSYFLA